MKIYRVYYMKVNMATGCFMEWVTEGYYSTIEKAIEVQKEMEKEEDYWIYRQEARIEEIEVK